MGSLSEESSNLVLDRCHLHTSTRRDDECSLTSKSIDIVIEEASFAGLLGGSLEGPEKLIQLAWALFLRKYLGNDIVTFAVMDHRPNDPSINNHEKVDWSIADAEVSVLQYCISAQCRLSDIRPIRFPVPAVKASQKLPINTAILLSVPLSSRFSQDTEKILITKLKLDSLVGNFDIILKMNVAVDAPQSLSMSYRWPKISTLYAKTLASTFGKVLSEMTLHFESEVGQLNFVSNADAQTMVAWNPKTLYSQMTCVHYLVEAVARAMPDSEAVCAWDGSLSYAQLDTLSSKVAQQLICSGVNVGDYVPFAFEKTLWTVVATLGILKAGAAFVPLDPTHPMARLHELLSSIGANVIVASTLYAATFKDIVSKVIIVSEQTPSDPAFVLFTSGSTGRPKGMIHEHGAICTHAITHGKAMQYQGARVLQFAAHTFDVAIIDIFTTLIFGGCICIPSDEDRMNNITKAINSMKANYAILTPSFANLIDPNDVPSIKTLAIGGEALTRDRIQRWADKVSLIQIYGPAEVGICLMMHMRPNDTLPETIGYPLPNSSCWLVDSDNPSLLVPIGAIGELVVAGPSLANSYLNDDVKTQTSFLTDLAWANALGLKEQRFYRTGDLLRYNVEAIDGSYDFIGRKDTQIKLRGQRLETGEVEHRLASIPGVAVSMVTRPKAGCFVNELVAVVQMSNSQTSCARNQPITIARDQLLSVESIKGHLSKTLPAYMWPTACLEVTRMPFVPSMKINRRMVDAWLADMKSRPNQVAAAMLKDLGYSRLDHNETTARVISVKYAELVAPNDDEWRMRLEASDFYLQRAGINSIQIVSLSMFLQRVYAVKVSMSRLLSSKLTIRELAYLIDHQHSDSNDHNANPTLDVLGESRALREGLFRDINARKSYTNSKIHQPPRNILLTGASGYLGTSILQDLMKRSGLFILALLRCATPSEGLRRIISTAKANGWWQEAYLSRIQVWKGDLAEEQLGLNYEQLQRLRGMGLKEDTCIHAVIHNGAKVHYNLDYESLKAVNVQSTLNLLKIAASAVHLSTFVYVSGGQKPCADTGEGSSPLCTNRVDQGNGYAESKFISENIVRHCAEHTIFSHKRLRTVKPGYIIGSLTLGLANQSDFIWRLIAGCIEVKAYNQDEMANWLFIADVDNVGQRVVSAIFDQCHSANGFEPILDGLLFSDLWQLLTERFGYTLEPLPHDEWLRRLHVAVAARQESHLLFPLLHILETEGGVIGSTEIPKAQSERSREAVARNVRQLIDVGFLPGPPQSTIGK